MAGKTWKIKELVKKTLLLLDQPFGTNIIEDVFLVIENDPKLLKQYLFICNELNTRVVNNWIAKYTKEITGKQSNKITSAKRSRLIKSFTKLENVE